MDELGLFTAALGLTGPWRVARTEFDAEQARLDLYLEFGRGARFSCPAAGCAHDGCPVHDTADKTWRHLDFFQHKAFLHARAPRVRCPQHGVRQVSVPWARPGSGFTMLFEALVLSFAAATGVAKVAAMTREHDTRIWRVLEHHVHAARDQLDCSGVRKVGVDETSAWTVPPGRQAQRAVNAVRPGRGPHPPGTPAHPLAVVQEPLEPLGDPTPRAAPADAALGPARDRPGTAVERGLPTPSTTSTPATRPSTCDAGATARNAPASNPSKTSSPSWRNTGTPVLAWHASRLNNGLLEGINSLVQAAKARARGYRNKNKMITIIYLTAAKLPLPTVTNPRPAYMPSR